MRTDTPDPRDHDYVAEHDQYAAWLVCDISEIADRCHRAANGTADAYDGPSLTELVDQVYCGHDDALVQLDPVLHPDEHGEAMETIRDAIGHLVDAAVTPDDFGHVASLADIDATCVERLLERDDVTADHLWYVHREMAVLGTADTLLGSPRRRDRYARELARRFAGHTGPPSSFERLLEEWLAMPPQQAETAFALSRDWTDDSLTGRLAFLHLAAHLTPQAA